MYKRLINLRVSNIRAEAKDVLVIELRDALGKDLPAFSPGAHLELRLPNDLRRQYSIASDPLDRSKYEIGVGLAIDSRGGSQFVHRSLRVGDKLTVNGPRNNFPIPKGYNGQAFIAGGIGITPIMAMIRHCQATETPWKLFYLVKNRQRAAFLEELSQFGDRVHLHSDDDAKKICDVPSTIKNIPSDYGLSCCGPASLMQAVEAATADWQSGRVSFEWFTATNLASMGKRDSFTVRLARSGLDIEITADKTILEAMEDQGLEPPFACREGVCGSCELRVIAGAPDHRDHVLTDAEKLSNETIMACVSRSLTDILEVDY